MPSNYNHTGINITHSKLQLVEVVNKDSKFFLNNVDEEYFNDFLDFSAKETKIISLLQSAFDDIVLRKKVQSDNVSFTLPQELFKIVDVPLDESLSGRDLVEHLKWELSILFPAENPGDYLIQYIPVDKNPYTQGKSAIVIGVLKNYLKSFHKFCARNNLKLKYIDNPHIASNSIVTLQSEASAEDPLLTIFLSDRVLSVVILLNSNPLMIRTKRLNKMLDAIPHLSSFMKKFSDLNLPHVKNENIFISGENISQNFIHQIGKSLNLSPIRINPFTDVNIFPHIKENEYFTDKHNSFSSAAGIAYRML